MSLEMTEELLDTLLALPDEDKTKLLYISKGMALKNENVTINNKSEDK